MSAAGAESGGKSNSGFFQLGSCARGNSRRESHSAAVNFRLAR